MTEQTMTPGEVLAELEDAADFRERVESMPAAAKRLREARTAVAALIARNAELEAERDALFNAAKRHAEAIQQSIRFKDGSGFLKTQAAFEYSEASKALWKLIDAARAEGCGNG